MFKFLTLLFFVSSLYADEILSVSINQYAFILLTTTSILSLLLLLTLVYIFHSKKKFREKLRKVHVEAKDAQRAKDTFLANVSHETRTPMTAIIGLSHILLQSELSETQKLNISKIKRSAEHLLAITNDILDYSKIEAGKLEINNANFDINHLFNNLADILGLQAAEKGLDLIFDISYRLPDTFIGDSLRISQVLINLINNAIKFTQEGQIVLRVKVGEQHNNMYSISFEVHDTGIGLTQEQIERLFHAFDQADNKISRKYGGTGLGLAISHELVEKMNGKLDVKSTFREGSVFAFTLPLDVPKENFKATDRHIKRALLNKTILILESNTYTAKMLSNTLSYYQALPKSISTIAQLNEQLLSKNFDAIFIDSRLIPQLPATDLLYEKCESVIVLNANPLSESTVASIKFDAVITKPFAYQSVVHVLSSLFTKDIVQNSVQKKEIILEDLNILQGSKILLAEDNAGNTMVVEGLLEGSGIEITSVIDGQKAVEAVFNAPDKYELILMDINMPVMDGYVATSIIREYQRYDHIPIVAMTANITESDIEKSKNYGMQSHLSKPIDVSAFYKTLLQFIKPKISVEKSQHLPKKETTSSSTVSLSTLPNIDVEDGVKRLNNNVKAYKNVLFKFCDMFTNVISELTTAVSEQNYEEGRALSHNLKGLSGNIGAKEIYSLAQELEDTFKDGDGEFQALLNAIERKLIPLMTGIRSLKQNEAPKDVIEKKPLDAKTKTKLLTALYHYAKKRKALDIKKCCQQLELYAWEEDQNEINAMIQSAQGYKFKEVCSSIEKLLPNVSQSAIPR